MSWEQAKADADVRELQQRLAAARRQLEDERAERRRAESRLNELEGRRSVRVAVTTAALARAALRGQRRARGRLRTLRRRATGGDQGGGGDVDGGANPFFAQLQSLFGDQALDRLCPPPAADDVGATLPDDSRLGDGPVVSVIMVVDETSGPVEQSLQAVLQQTYGRWELIVRDCTSGAALDSASETRDPRVSVARLRSPNEGVARNHGLASAKGELIAYLDPPNLWHPRFLESLLAALIRDHARYAVCCAHLDADAVAPQGRPRGEEADDGDYAEQVEQQVVALNAMVHWRELYDEIGGASTSSSIATDRDLLLKYTFVRDPLRIDDCLLLEKRRAAVRDSAASGDDRPRAAVMRASVETHFRERLPRRTGSRRPSLTVVGGVGALAQEKAWDLAAAATEVTSSQLVGFTFGGVPTYAPRFLPTPETETVRLDGRWFPEWAPMLARGVANVHGDVVYAAEPRLPSLGLALLASYHHGVPVIADVSHPPVTENDSRTPDVTTEEPVGLDEVDPSDDVLLDPRSPLWDRIMAGVVQELPARAVDSLAQAGGRLVVPHPKDERVFDPGVRDRELTRRRLGLAPDERVLVVGGPGAINGSAVGGGSHLLDVLASRFRVVILEAEPEGEGPTRCRHGRGLMVVDRSDEEGVAAALTASDALLLWVDPRSHPDGHGLPPELGSALAMGVPVIANHVGELGALGRDGFVRLVPFGEVDRLAECLEGSRRDERQHHDQIAAGSHLFMRRFSHAAARVNVTTALRLVECSGDPHRLAEEFASFIAAFYRRWASTGGISG